MYWFYSSLEHVKLSDGTVYLLQIRPSYSSVMLNNKFECSSLCFNLSEVINEVDTFSAICTLDLAPFSVTRSTLINLAGKTCADTLSQRQFIKSHAVSKIMNNW